MFIEKNCLALLLKSEIPKQKNKAFICEQSHTEASSGLYENSLTTDSSGLKVWKTINAVNLTEFQAADMHLTGSFYENWCYSEVTSVMLPLKG